MTSSDLTKLMNNLRETPLAPLNLDGALPVPESFKKDVIEPTDTTRSAKDIRDAGLKLEDYVLFTLAPVYWVVKVPFDLASEFMKEHKHASVLRLGLPNKIIDIPGWEHVIEAIDKAHFDKFADFLGQCVFQRAGQMSSICGDYVDLPYALSGHSRIAVFTPRGLLVRFKPGIGLDGKIVLYQAAPEDQGKIGELTNALKEVIHGSANQQA